MAPAKIAVRKMGIWNMSITPDGTATLAADLAGIMAQISAAVGDEKVSQFSARGPNP
jgi:hypothetical protein